MLKCDSSNKCIENDDTIRIFDNRDDEFYLTLIIAARLELDHPFAKKVRDRLEREQPEAFGAIKLDDTVKKDYVHKFCKTKCGLGTIVGNHLSGSHVRGTEDKVAGDVANYLKDVYSVRQDVKDQIRTLEPENLPVTTVEDDGNGVAPTPAPVVLNPMCEGTNYHVLTSKKPEIRSKFEKSSDECIQDKGCEDPRECMGDTWGCGLSSATSVLKDVPTNEEDISSKYPQLGSCASKKSGNEFSKDIMCLAGQPIYKWLDTSDKMCLLVDDFNHPIKDKDQKQMKVPLSSYSSTRLESMVTMMQDVPSLAACKIDTDVLPKCRKVSVETIHVNPGSSRGEPTVHRCCSERYVAVKDIECEMKMSITREENNLESTFTCEKRSAYSKLYGTPIKFDHDAKSPTDSCFCQELKTAKNQGQYDGHKQGMTNQFGSPVRPGIGVGRVGGGGVGIGGGVGGTFASKCWRASFLVAVGLLLMVLYVRVLY